MAVLLPAMCRRLVHRGPDDEGYYSAGPAHLAVRRLSIIDLETGHQPLTNEDGSIWVIFNGEIYNYRELRQSLIELGHRFATRSDTEVIVHAYEEYGADCLAHFNGMFALAVWDSRRQTLFLARDRVGIKPLYYWTDGRQLVFGSELKAMLPYPAVPREPDPVALDHFLTLEYIPAPRTIFAGVRKLPAGHWLEFSATACRLESYWEVSLESVTTSLPESAEILADLLEQAIRLRLRSDVPLGAFLSGGIDSSTIVAFMRRALPGPLQTFSIGFGDPTYDELPYAREVAERFATDHVERVQAADIADLAVELVTHLDEPLGDFSIFPTYLVSKLAAESVKVVLSGDGGDEILGGYDTYVAQRWARMVDWLPASMRQRWLPAAAGRLRPQAAKKGLTNKTRRFLEGAALAPEWGHTRWMTFLSPADRAALYRPALRQALDGVEAPALLAPYFETAQNWPSLNRQQFVDVKGYLAENILTKVDRMSMAASIEARVPFLDHRIVTFALNLPPAYKLWRGQTKRILRLATGQLLPERILKKPKEGFSIPLKHWLRGPLRPLMLDLLAGDGLRRRGYFEPATVDHWVTEHLAQRANHSHRLWALMVFELWARHVARL